MTPEQPWHDLLHDYRKGKLSEQSLLRRLRDRFYRSHFRIIQDVARLDPHRHKKSGIEEVIFAQGKSQSQLTKILFPLLEGVPSSTRLEQIKKTKRSQNKKSLLITRLSAEIFERISQEYRKEFSQKIPLVYHPQAQIAHFIPEKGVKRGGKPQVAVLTAGSSDIPVAEECWRVLAYWGIKTECYYDVGVAALDRLLGVIERVKRNRVVIVVAGMEAALASVVGGLVSSPVISVPTSVGYGAHFQGLSSLLGMMNSCSPGVVVVNIDNGFGAAAAARKILEV